MNRIAVPGAEGAFSHLAAMELFPEARFVFYPVFSDVLNAVRTGGADKGVLPVENSSAGRVTDVHRLLPEAQVFITGEHFLRIEHHLLGVRGTQLQDVSSVYSHPQALTQCSEFILKTGVRTRACDNTALAAKEIARKNDKSCAAIASKSAANENGLVVLKENIEDSSENRTRFLIISKTPESCGNSKNVITSFVFFVKHEPAALYHALGAFAQNDVNLLRLESYIDSKNFISAGFFADVAADLSRGKGKQALEMLKDFTQSVTILGTYPASGLRPVYD